MTVSSNHSVQTVSSSNTENFMSEDEVLLTTFQAISSANTYLSTLQDTANAQKVSKLRWWIQIQLQDAFSELSQMDFLNVSYPNSLKNLPYELFQLKNLEELHIQGDLSQISPEIGQLKNLKLLYIHTLRPLMLPNEVYQLNLTTLDQRSKNQTHQYYYHFNQSKSKLMSQKFSFKEKID